MLALCNTSRAVLSKRTRENDISSVFLKAEAATFSLKVGSEVVRLSAF